MDACRPLEEALRRWLSRGEVLPYAELLAEMKAMELDWSELARLFPFDERAYRRNSIARNEHFEALVLCWRSGQMSPIHDHARSSCVVRVAVGTATETRFRRTGSGHLVAERSRRLAAGSTLGCRDGGIHQLGNLEAEGQDLITLHVYSPPPASWRYYTLDQTAFAGHDRLIHEPAKTVIVDLGSARPAPKLARAARSRKGVQP
ncbi:MAG: cysteine dioxygenase family protein [Isosphaeraceae bacterium]